MKDEEVRDKLKPLIQEMEKLRATRDAAIKERARLEEVAKGIKPPIFTLPGLLGKYMSAVKETNGLISARPSSVVALQNAEKNATEASVKKAIAALDEHSKVALKEAGSDANKKKSAEAFTKKLHGIEEKLKAL